MNRVCIPDEEYAARIKRAAKLASERGLDVLVVVGTESDYANPRYFSGFWPLFERCGVAISASGNAALMVGPESRIFAQDVAKIEKVFVLKEFRESADPSYPELKADTFRDVFRAIGVAGDKIRIGLGSYLDFTLPIVDGLKDNYPQADISVCADIMVSLRKIKSANEIACLKEALRITEIATSEVIRHLRPGATELEMVGIAQKAIYENGAEYEGLPMYVFSEKSTRHAISRSGYRKICEGDIVQLNLSAKVDGYSPSIGLPVSIGKISPEKRRFVEFGLEAHRWTQDKLRAGVIASDIAKEFYRMYEERGMSDYYIYGPCHGMGMIEVEAPWMETDSDYPLEENMVFNIDTFVSAPSFGVRWEKGAVIKKDGCELLSDYLKGIVEV
ncbi:MAG TPA: Xaa-Pro peptidase family protein [Candidatus Borkfalkia excrementavium]|uniref:Xaa-Pro peptidase family protein n=1 Tax=Candidatus Borkfalkia excrementavium TaxID=2838505 RepID=A0A9D1Z8C9_9FIRM|nr:Xaa-Pro peptidase family protein [Candidatus Borkfalkia excrementavium]